jgi:hypothetical protein
VVLAHTHQVAGFFGRRQNMDYSILRTGLFGVSYVGHVNFFVGGSESEFKNNHRIKIEKQAYQLAAKG